MTTLAASLGKAGPGTSQTIDGKIWTLTRSTWNIQAAWGKWYADRVEASVMDTAAAYRKRSRALAKDVKAWTDEERADEMPTPERGAELAALIEDASKEAMFLDFEARAIIERFGDRKAAGEFEYTGNAGMGVAMQNLPGQIYLAYLCLQPNHPGITLEEVTEAYKSNGQAWSAFIIRAEGVGSKNGGASSASTPASTEKSPATKNSTPQPTAPTAAQS